MEEAGVILLPKRSEENEGVVEISEQGGGGGGSGGCFMQQLKKVSYMAAPMVAVTVSQFLLQIVSVMMAGHLGKLSLSGVAIATSFADVTGFSVLLGMAGALETLCGQTYGAEQFNKLGNYICCAIISLILVCLPISVLWVFMDKVLIFFGQDPTISILARNYCIWLIPALFGYAVLQSLIRYFQIQSLIFPMVLSSITALCLHIPLCWGLVFKLELGHVGAALAIGISYWFNVIFLGLYMKHSSACQKTKIVFTSKAFLSIREFVQFAIPSAVMVCLEWWSFELIILLAGLLPNPQLETSVLSICLNTTTLHYFIPYGVGAAASTRVSNELGAGNHRAAQEAVRAVVVLGIAEAILVSSALFCFRHLLGYTYSNEKEVVDNVAEMVPLLCLSVSVDSLLGVLSGVARGSGWQEVGAYVNLGAYYIVGIPVAALLGFGFDFKGKGLWVGILTGSSLQAILLALITAFTNWQTQATKARERIFETASSPDHSGFL
ncbi:Protein DETOXIFICATION [Quillaja saponaria]|uniref:Protein DETOXIFICATION n=1 Tax=Quillaja saponaria TaxID=32244 RepID=A0AAD7Q7C0_QUISA|nr:Protein DETOXIFICATION [Quillaja saponaria]